MKNLHRHISFDTTGKAKKQGKLGIADMSNYLVLKNLCFKGAGLF
jgi:hypothetical protein